MKTDSQLYNDIIDKLEFEPMIDPVKITIGIHEGVVTLRGIVGSHAEKKIIERARDMYLDRCRLARAGRCSVALRSFFTLQILHLQIQFL